MITQAALKNLLDYNPATGSFVWRVNPVRGAKRAGQRAGYVLAQGHERIKISGREYPSHRLAWLYMTGQQPSHAMEIDHINQNRADNRWANLRLATPSDNSANRRVSRNCKSRLKGVVKTNNNWRASIKKRGAYYHLGMFDCPAAANFAYQLAAMEHHGEFAHPGF